MSEEHNRLLQELIELRKLVRDVYRLSKTAPIATQEERIILKNWLAGMDRAFMELLKEEQGA
jgi:hypothetical protein